MKFLISLIIFSNDGTLIALGSLRKRRNKHLCPVRRVDRVSFGPPQTRHYSHVHTWAPLGSQHPHDGLLETIAHATFDRSGTLHDRGLYHRIAPNRVDRANSIQLKPGHDHFRHDCYLLQDCAWLLSDLRHARNTHLDENPVSLVSNRGSLRRNLARLGR